MQSQFDKIFFDADNNGVKEEIRPLFVKDGRSILPPGVEIRVEGDCVYSEHTCSNSAWKRENLTHEIQVFYGGLPDDIGIFGGQITEIRTPKSEIKKHFFYEDETDDFFRYMGENPEGNFLEPHYKMNESHYSDLYDDLRKRRNGRYYFNTYDYENLLRIAYLNYVEDLKNYFEVTSSGSDSTAIYELTVENRTTGETTTYYVFLELIFSKADAEGYVQVRKLSFRDWFIGTYRPESSERELICDDAVRCLLTEKGKYSIYGSFNSVEITDFDSLEFQKEKILIFILWKENQICKSLPNNFNLICSLSWFYIYFI